MREESTGSRRVSRALDTLRARSTSRGSGAAPRGSLRMSRATRRPITLDDIPRLTWGSIGERGVPGAGVVVLQRQDSPYPLGVKSDTEGVKVGVKSDTESVKVVQYKSSTKSVKV